MNDMSMDVAAFNADLELGHIERGYDGLHILPLEIVQTNVVSDYLGPFKGKQNSMLSGSFGLVSSQVCSFSTAGQHVSCRSTPERLD